ncbi:MAG: pyruvate dehydrogenase, partial [Alphaproteobacteria bacterium]|nr:pyruvate dehydrogenase [Alphaproteobacteria bacterium]
MGRFVFKLPDVGEGTAEAELVGWHVKVGDTVAEDQIVADVMTDKATVEITAPVSGKVIALHGEPGAMVPVRGPLVEFEVEGAGNADEGTPSSPASPVLPPRGGDRAASNPPPLGEVAPKATEGADAAPTGNYVFKLPDVGEGTAEAELVGWHVKVGDVVEEDQIIADIMTDKATVEITSPVAGTVVALYGEAGQQVPVGGPLVAFDVAGAGNVAKSPVQGGGGG